MSVDALIAEGVQLGQAKSFPQAIDRFRAALEIQPSAPEVHFNLGVAYRGVGREAEAIEAFQAALELEPNHPEALFNLGNSYRDAGRTDKAVDCLCRAIELRPTYHKALNNLGNLYTEISQLAESSRSADGHRR
jgi:Flp pilus assembly protein TadD